MTTKSHVSEEAMQAARKIQSGSINWGVETIAEIIQSLVVDPLERRIAMQVRVHERETK